MSNFKALEPISEQKISATGVVSLAIRPNQNNSQYGIGNLTGKELQKKFDNLARLAIARCNELVKLLSGKYLPSEDSPPESAESILEYILAFKGSESENIPTDMSLKDVLDNILTTSAELKAIDPTEENTTTFDALNNVLKKTYERLMHRVDDVDTAIYELQTAITELETALISKIDEVAGQKINYTDIVDNLYTNDPNKPLSAAQGLALMRRINDGGGGSSLVGGKLAWNTEYDASKPIQAIKIGGFNLQEIETGKQTYVSTSGNLEFLYPGRLNVMSAWVEIALSYGMLVIEPSETPYLFFVKSVISFGEQISLSGINLLDGKDYIIRPDYIHGWLQLTEAESGNLSVALDELHEYAQDIISGVSE